MGKNDNMRVDRLSKFIQEKIENEAIEFDPAAWEAMEKKLDEHLPTEKKLSRTETKNQQQVINELHSKNSQPSEKYNSHREEDKPVVKKYTPNNFFSGCSIHEDYFDYWIYNSTYSEATVGIYHRQNTSIKEFTNIETNLIKPIKQYQIIHAINYYNGS